MYILLCRTVLNQESWPGLCPIGRGCVLDEDSEITRWTMEHPFAKLLTKPICLRQESASSCDYCLIILLEGKHLLLQPHHWLSSICLAPNTGPTTAGWCVWLGNM